METYTVTLPSGLQIQNVPVGTSQEVLKDRLISAGKATLDDFEVSPKTQVPTPDPTPDPTLEPDSVANERKRGSTVGTTGDGTSIADVGQYLKENLELAGGVGGGVLGAIIGSPAGPVGAMAGSMLLSAIGTGAGSLASDELKGEDLNYAEAMKEAAISLGFDVATLTAGKVLKPAYVLAKKKLGFTPEEAAEQMIKELEPAVGTQASLKASQEILEEGGATLTPSQVGATGLQLISEKIGRIGILSGGRFEENARLVNEATQDGLNEVVNRLSVNSSGSPEELAQSLMGVIDAGKQALSKNYGDGLDELAALAPSGARFGVGKHISSIDRFLVTRTKDGIVDLDPAAVKFIEKNLRPMMGNNLARGVGLDALIILDKQMTAQIRQKFGTPGTKSYNPDAERQLAQLAEEMRNATYSALQKVDPALASQYKTLKEGYAAGFQGLLPEINSNFVRQANKDNYFALGSTLLGAGNASQIVAFKKSLREAFNQIEKSGGKTAGPFMAYQEAESLLKKGFLQNLFPDLATETFSIDTYRTLARRLSSNVEQERFRAVLGADFPRVKQLINLMAEASTKPAGNIGELAARGKEYQAGRSLIGTFAQGAASVGMGTSGAIAILATPIFLAKAALNPAHVNRLIAFNSKKFKDSGAMEAAAVSIIGSVMDDMTEEEQAEFRNYMRKREQ
tara:strand:+ start:1257 stop:3302 length:2046 start_codon:yes stop_codon:yes gene_type:complete